MWTISSKRVIDGVQMLSETRWWTLLWLLFGVIQIAHKYENNGLTKLTTNVYACAITSFLISAETRHDIIHTLLLTYS